MLAKYCATESHPSVIRISSYKAGKSILNPSLPLKILLHRLQAAAPQLRSLVQMSLQCSDS